MQTPIELEEEFRRVYNLLKLEENSKFYTTDRALAFMIVELMQLSVSKAVNWTVSDSATFLEMSDDLLTAIFKVAIKAFGVLPSAKAVYEHLHQDVPDDVVTFHTKHNKRFKLVEHFNYYPSGADDDFENSYDTLCDALIALRECVVESSREVTYVYDSDTGLQYHLKSRCNL